MSLAVGLEPFLEPDDHFRDLVDPNRHRRTLLVRITIVSRGIVSTVSTALTFFFTFLSREAMTSDPFFSPSRICGRTEHTAMTCERRTSKATLGCCVWYIPPLGQTTTDRMRNATFHAPLDHESFPTLKWRCPGQVSISEWRLLRGER